MTQKHPRYSMWTLVIQFFGMGCVGLCHVMVVLLHHHIPITISVHFVMYICSQHGSYISLFSLSGETRLFPPHCHVSRSYSLAPLISDLSASACD